MTKIHEKLAAIQADLKAPKDNYNQFGKYNYRKAEDILEAVKPLLKAQGCDLTCSDELLLIGDRYYIRATATLTCIEDGSAISTSAFAREEEEKKGMDGSQVTGASSSYARKYALNGLFCIDDTADSDTTNQGEGTPAKKPAATKAGEKQQEQPAQPSRVPELSADAYAKWVEAIARQMSIKASGLPAKDHFIQNFFPTRQELAQLSEAVGDFKINHGLK